MHIAPTHLHTPRIKAIDDSTFKGGSNLTNLAFCNRVEEVCVLRCDAWVVESGSSWKVPQYLLLLISPMQHSMAVGSSPSTKLADQYLRYSETRECLLWLHWCRAYRVRKIEWISHVVGLAIWKSKIMQQLRRNKDPFSPDLRKKMYIRSVSMVTIIVPNVLFFL